MLDWSNMCVYLSKIYETLIFFDLSKIITNWNFSGEFRYRLSWWDYEYLSKFIALSELFRSFEFFLFSFEYGPYGLQYFLHELINIRKDLLSLYLDLSKITFLVIDCIIFISTSVISASSLQMHYIFIWHSISALQYQQ